MKRLVVVGAILWAAPSAALADSAVVSGGAEVAIGEHDSPVAYVAPGAFLRLAWVPTIPGYTTATRGYVWNRGFGFDATLRRGELEKHSYEAALLGLRYDITFSQRREGLMRISGKGGFYFVGRTGLLRSDAFGSDDGAVGVTVFVDDPIPDVLPERPEPPRTRLVTSAAAGTYVRFGRRVRLITEVGAFAIGGRGSDVDTGLHVRVGLGLDL